MKLPVNKSILGAAGIAVAITGWLASGLFASEETEPNDIPVPQAQEKKTIQVLTQRLEAENHAKIISLFGKTEANRDVSLKAQTAGKVVEVLIEKGQTVKQGDVIARIDIEDRDRKLKSAQALVRQRELEYDASRKLSKKSFRSATTLAENEALLQSARAELDRIKLDIAHTEIKAPFNGILDDRMIEIGDFVDTGDQVARVVDLSPIVVSGEVSEQEVLLLKNGQTASAILQDGRVVNGQITYVAASSQTTTRTYRMEMKAVNPGGEIPAGLTAKIRLKVGQMTAQKISPAIISLSDTGQIGVKTVDADNKVGFHTISLVEDTPDGLWVNGLPDNAQVIIRGQEYVSPGQTVIAVDAAQAVKQEKAPELVQAEGAQ